MTGPHQPPRPPDREQLGAEVRDLAWAWARRRLSLAPGQRPLTMDDVDTPEQAREAWLALLGVCEQLRLELDDCAAGAARAAAAAGADYGDLGNAVAITRQGARRRWPGLAARSRAAREQHPAASSIDHARH